jgi:septum formation protein
VYFRALSADEVAWYVASGEGRDKAGAYAIQGLASRFIPRIEGSYSNVVGLPVAAVAELLTSLLASGS